MRRNGFFLCSEKSGFINLAYLTQVRYGHLHCPKYEEIRLKSCADPPIKASIVDAIMVECHKQNVNLGFDADSKVLPDKLWLL
jgi:hypothetical protein